MSKGNNTNTTQFVQSSKATRKEAGLCGKKKKYRPVKELIKDGYVLSDDKKFLMKKEEDGSYSTYTKPNLEAFSLDE